MKTSAKSFLFLVAVTALVLFACKSNRNNNNSTCVEKIDPECMCTMQYDPVCGCNNKTYGNACNARCSGITEFTPGECK